MLCERRLMFKLRRVVVGDERAGFRRRGKRRALPRDDDEFFLGIRSTTCAAPAARSSRAKRRKFVQFPGLRAPDAFAPAPSKI